jgi:hypothetical protein
MRRVFGTVTPDPAAFLPVGAKLHFKPELFPVGTPPGEYTVDNWDHYAGVLLHLQIADKQTVFVHGSAVLVAPGIALASRHVIEPYFSLMCAGGATVTCESITSSHLMMWRCRKITFVDAASDLAILVLSYCSDLPEENVFKLASITTRTPQGRRAGLYGRVYGGRRRNPF